MKIGLLHHRIRKDEKHLIKAAKSRGWEFDLIKDSKVLFDIKKNGFDYDLVLERSISHITAMYALKILNNFGVRTINSGETAQICGSKLLVSEALITNNIPTPKVRIAFTEQKALQAIEKMGYPAVLKPAIGSWGKLLAKVNDRQAAEAVLNHKKNLGTYHHSVFYIQEYIEKPGRDIRAFVIGDKVYAVYRKSDHWITHINKGAKIQKCPVTDKIRKLALSAKKAVRGDFVCVDILESKSGLKVLEVDYTPEFSQYFPHLDEKIIDDVINYLEVQK
ncbi:MAG: Glutamate--LysW ligase ArgX [Candidatus Woesearchaeota archaeon]|nr:Glutamate--LysW ligase ArgX [Candidatus Woesearchaeota archaeon]